MQNILTSHSRASAGGIILGPDGRMAVVQQHGNSWSFPKGKIEKGETPLAAAQREIFEETGITDLQLVRELGSYERYSLATDGVSEQVDGGLRRRTFFLFDTIEPRLTPHDDEITEVRFVTLDEALSLLTHPMDRAFLERHRAEIEKNK